MNLDERINHLEAAINKHEGLDFLETLTDDRLAEEVTGEPDIKAVDLTDEQLESMLIYGCPDITSPREFVSALITRRLLHQMTYAELEALELAVKNNDKDKMNAIQQAAWDRLHDAKIQEVISGNIGNL